MKIFLDMPSNFVFLREYKVKDEVVWEYSCDLTFNKKQIVKLTITEYYQGRPGRERITNDLICQLMSKLRGKKRLRPTNYSGSRKVFRLETTYQDKKYRLIFWYKDDESDHLWIRNCYPI